uniref:LIM domain-binding protein 3-like n=1 Tax=Ciona intestinalis TaxID=7719 RepID=F6X5Z3_CIOIN|nr:LIM domain-binding protein 3-like [Ciona intestinalis]|eukprot:XP_002129221.1 LIM domain-binding protein 3-like [Ciona intestinalis]
MSNTLVLTGGPPWGFRIVGGADVDQNLVVSRVTPGSPAAKGNLRSRDILLAINGTILKDASRAEAEAIIRTASGNLEVVVKLATAWDAKPGRMKAADPTWVTLAQQLEKPRPVGQTGAEGSLVTQGKRFESAQERPTVAEAEHPVLEPRRFIQSDAEIVCNTCAQPISGGEYSTVEGINFHKECFICAAPNCQGNLDAGFIVDGGKAYCVTCHNKYFSQPCLKCNKPIFEEAFRALNCQWHLSCFICTECNQPMYDGVFHMEGGRVYCGEDHERLFGVTCYACRKLIGPGDSEMNAIGQKWHDRCFNCPKCRKNLNAKRFVRRGGFPFCPTCK